MKKILFVVPLLLLAACTDPRTAIRAAESSGLTDVKTLGYSWFACGKDDSFATSFVAKNAQGKEVRGTVCSGWFKGATIRFE